MARAHRNPAIADQSSVPEIRREKLIDAIYLALFSTLLIVMILGWICLIGSFIGWLFFL